MDYTRSILKFVEIRQMFLVVYVEICKMLSLRGQVGFVYNRKK